MKIVKAFEDFINESIDVKYWMDYNTDTSGQSDPSFATKIKVFDIAFEEGVETWNAEADGKENQIDSKQAKKIEKLAYEFFKREKWISINIIHAMIAQEGYAGESVEITTESSELNEASYGKNTIYEIATPAPTEMLVRELTDLLGLDKSIVRGFVSPEGFESVLMINLTPSDIKKIKDEIGDVLIFKMDLSNRKEI